MRACGPPLQPRLRRPLHRVAAGHRHRRPNGTEAAQREVRWLGHAARKHTATTDVIKQAAVCTQPRLQPVRGAEVQRCRLCGVLRNAGPSGSC